MRRTAMTLPETLIAAAAVGLLLVVAALGLSWVRTELKVRQARELLGTLDAALSAYHQAVGQWPAAESATGLDQPAPATWPAPGAPLAATSDTQAAADRIIAALVSVPASREVLDRIPGVLRVSGRADAGAGTAPALSVRDPWGGHLRCLTAASRRETDRQAVAANAGKPVFASAGPDREFGLDDPAAAADNILLLPSPGG